MGLHRLHDRRGRARGRPAPDRARAVPLGLEPGGAAVLISTLPQEKQLALLERLAGRDRDRGDAAAGSDTYQTLLQPIETGDGSSINVLLQRSLEEARRPLRRLELQIFALSSAALLLAIVAAIFFARGVTSPLRRLAEAAQRIGSGDYSTPVEIPQDDEMGQLAAAFNRMGTEISAREVERTRAEEALRTAEEQYRLLFDSNPYPDVGLRPGDPAPSWPSTTPPCATTATRGTSSWP